MGGKAGPENPIVDPLFGRFGYPKLKKRNLTNSLEGDTRITRDLGIPYMLTI